MCISANRFRYSAFGREANRTLKDIKVPSVEDVPNWVQRVNMGKFDQRDEPISSRKLPVPTIQEYTRLDELFTVKNGLASGGLVERDKRDQGLVMYIRPAATHLRTRRSFIKESSVVASQIHPPGTLFVSTNGEGSHTYSYVSTEKIVANSDVAVLLPKAKMSLEMKMFYSRCISANRYLFSYGRKPKGEKLKRLMLPKFSERLDSEVSKFMRSLRFSSTAFSEKLTGEQADAPNA